MQPTDGTATSPAGGRQPSQLPGRHHDERGLMTLEWLLIVGAMAGIAAMSVATVQRVLDDHTEVRADPAVRLIDADIAAAFLAAEANEAALSPLYDDNDFSPRCNALERAFDDVVFGAEWTTPLMLPADPADPADPAELDNSAKCQVTPKGGLGG